MPIPILTPAEWAAWRMARQYGDLAALEEMLVLLARAGRWRAIAAVALDTEPMLRVGWRIERVSPYRYEVLAPGPIAGSLVVLGAGATTAEAIVRAEERIKRADAMRETEPPPPSPPPG